MNLQKELAIIGFLGFLNGSVGRQADLTQTTCISRLKGKRWLLLSRWINLTTVKRKRARVIYAELL